MRSVQKLGVSLFVSVVTVALVVFAGTLGGSGRWRCAFFGRW